MIENHINKKKELKKNKKFIKNKLNIFFSKKNIITGIIYGFISSIGYSIVPLMLYIIPYQEKYGNIESPINTTFYVTFQEIITVFIIFFLKPKKFINFSKLLFYKEAWLIILYGFLGGPLAMIFFQLSILLTINYQGNTDSTVPGLLLNLNIILVAIGSNIFFNINQSKYTWIALIISTCLIFGISIHFILEEGLSWSSIGGMSLSLITAILYAVEALGMSHLISFSKIKFTNYEVVLIKTISSVILMITLVMPISAILSKKNFLDCYKIFINFKYYKYAMIFFIGGVIMGISRILYYTCLSISGATYTTSTQLFMFFWTPIFQYIFNILQVSNKILKPTWYYWIYVIPIIFCAFIISSNEFLIYANKIGWKKIFYKIFNNI